MSPMLSMEVCLSHTLDRLTALRRPEGGIRTAKVCVTVSGGPTGFVNFSLVKETFFFNNSDLRLQKQRITKDSLLNKK